MIFEFQASKELLEALKKPVECPARLVATGELHIELVNRVDLFSFYHLDGSSVSGAIVVHEQ
jgi:hypothetical protein